jgi:hypothetical protein
MYFLPCLAQSDDVIQQLRLNVMQPVFRKTEIRPQAQWACRAIQVENCAASLPDDVNVRRPVIVGVDNNSQTPQSKNGWHVCRVP